MYPKDCCKIKPSYVNDIPTDCNHIMQSYHHIMASFHSAMNLTILRIISFHLFPCHSHDYCFLTTFSRHLNQNINIFINNLKNNKMKLI